MYIFFYIIVICIYLLYNNFEFLFYSNFLYLSTFGWRAAIVQCSIATGVYRQHAASCRARALPGCCQPPPTPLRRIPPTLTVVKNLEGTFYFSKNLNFNLFFEHISLTLHNRKYA